VQHLTLRLEWITTVFHLFNPMAPIKSNHTAMIKIFKLQKFKICLIQQLQLKRQIQRLQIDLIKINSQIKKSKNKNQIKFICNIIYNFILVNKLDKLSLKKKEANAFFIKKKINADKQ
jgi:hypothetical protein